MFATCSARWKITAGAQSETRRLYTRVYTVVCAHGQFGWHSARRSAWKGKGRRQQHHPSHKPARVDDAAEGWLASRKEPAGAGAWARTRSLVRVSGRARAWRSRIICTAFAQRRRARAVLAVRCGVCGAHVNPKRSPAQRYPGWPASQCSHRRGHLELLLGEFPPQPTGASG